MEPIAITGIGCRFPKAGNPKGYWDLLSHGVDGIGDLPDDRRRLWQSLVGGELPPTRGGYLAEIDHFDPEFFGIAPREAERLDPQHRLLLEVTWEALEDAGEVPARAAEKRVGVFVGVMNADHAHVHGHALDRMDAHLGTGSSLGIAANRLSYVFDFRGPSLAIDTLCSSSLVAVHLACRSLLADESSPFALAGGVNIISHPGMQLFYAKAGLLSAGGHCRPFDRGANGIVRGEGAGVVVLKRLSRALGDGDSIYATIRGSAVNQDGRSNGLTAPNRWSQEAVLREAYRVAGVSPGRVGYVEAHGTGTLIGDPIEAAALGAVLKEDRAPERPCLLGSVKSNFGHLESAAGIAGLIKTALALYHRAIPPSLHFETANPYIRFSDLPLRVARSCEPWPDHVESRLAGVSSFGLGGTNAHAVLESVFGGAGANQGEAPYLLPLSAKSDASLRALAERWRDDLRMPSNPVHDAVFTASDRRSHHAIRLAVVGDSSGALADELDAFLRNEPRAADSGRLGRGRGRWLLSEATRYEQGGDPDPAGWRQDQGRVLRLPTYPFRRRHLSTGVAAEITDRRVGATEARSEDGLVYAIEWEPLVEPRESAQLAQTSWLVAAGDSGLGVAIAERLRASGATCSIVPNEDARSTDDTMLRWRRLLDQTTDQRRGFLTGVIYVPDPEGAEKMPPSQLWGVTRSVCDNARGLLQAVVQGRDVAPPRLWFVTRSAEKVGNESPNPVQSMLAGIGRALGLEQPELWGRHIDLAVDHGVEESAAAIVSELSTPSREAEIAFRSGERWVRRLSRREVPRGTIECRADRTYLVTGGLGGLGLLTARWLVSKGAIHLVLMGRRAPNSSAKEAIGELERAGAKVHVRSADVALEADVAKVIGEMKASMPPLAGVVHAAGVLADGFLYQQTWDRFAAALAPKMMGALLLHDQTKDQKLDFFILYSSVASLLGSAGQSNYAAGNAYLDALAHLRRSAGLAALSVNWGPWAEAGMVRDLARSGFAGRFGLLSTTDAMSALDRLLASGQIQAGVMSANWKALASENAAVRDAPVLSRLVKGVPSPIEPSGRAKIASLVPGARFDVVVEHLKSEVALALGMPPSEIDLEQPLEQLGFDSMMALDVRVGLEKTWGTTLPIATFVEANLRALAEQVVVALAGSPTVTSPSTGAPSEESQGTHKPRLDPQSIPWQSASPWLVPIRVTDNPAMRLLCFPYAGGGAHVYREWAEGLPESVDVIAIQLPGRGRRRAEALLTNMDSIVKGLLPDLAPLLDRPFAMFGHCLGAVTMFETTRRLAARFDKHPLELFASGCPAPQIYLIPHIYSQSNEQFSTVLRLINFRSSEPIFQDESLLNLALPAVRADFEVASKYAFEAATPPASDTLDVPITAFGAWEDLFAPLSAIEAWRERTTRPVAIYMRPGGHYFLETERAFLQETVSTHLKVHLATPRGATPVSRRARSRFIVTPNPNADAKMRLVCFPYAGGDASLFSAFEKGLPAGVEVSAIELPGRGKRISETPLTRVESIAEALVPELVESLRGPVVFFGHDIGAMIMLQTARLLHERGAELPRRLVVSSAIAPHLNHLSPIHVLGDQRFREILSFFGLRSDENLRDLRADFEAISAYRPALARPLPIPITAFGAMQDTLVPYGGIEAWSHYTARGFSLIRVDGDHYHWSSDPGRAAMLDEVGRLLDADSNECGKMTR